MLTQVKLRFVRGSASKMRPLINLVRGKGVLEAKNILSALDDRRYSKTIIKLINSAISNLKAKGLNQKDLYISKITADNGPVWKRFRAASFGRATGILKRTSHIKLELDLRR
ncbi:MAG: 50S ribosomal protein L22 [Candidatus Omnitrophota bacterium]